MSVSILHQWFASLHDVLDELILRYPGAAAAEQAQLREQWQLLKKMSDELVENWLRLEEKLSVLQELDEHGALASVPAELLGPFYKGQGYFKLHMFRQAAEQLEDTVRMHPDMLSARLYLAMSRMHLQEWLEAQRHFRFIAALTEDVKMRAIAYNALGCIQAIHAQFDQAQQLFRKALEADPSFRDPKINLESCESRDGALMLQFGSAELQSMV